MVSNEANRPIIIFYRIGRVYISCGCYSFVTNVLLIADIASSDSNNYREVIIGLLSDRFRSFDYIDHLYYYLVREHGIECSRSTLNRYIRNDEVLDGLFRRKKTQKFFERFETEPGVQAQFDLKEKIKIIFETGEIKRVNVATLTLGFSRYNIREIVLDTKYETIISFLAGAFETLGGVPKELVIDNIKCLVDKPRTSDNDAVFKC